LISFYFRKPDQRGARILSGVFWKISFRLPAIIVSLVILAGVAVGTFAYMESSKSFLLQARDELTALRDARHAAISQYFRSIEEDLEILANNK
jgi:hypothetical protein